MRQFRYVAFAVVAAGLPWLSSTAYALEGGASVYPQGAENYLVGALPPPGTYLLSYTEFYDADRFNDGNGNKLFPRFHLQAFVEAPRLVEVLPFKLLGGSPFIAALVPLVDESVKVDGARGSTSGFIEANLGEGLGWHLSPSLHVAVGLDEFLPTGNYSPTDIASASLNRYAVEPVFAFTYVNPHGPEFDIKAMYDFNIKNQTTDYLSGQDFHFDYALGWNLGPKWTVGAGGYFENQTTDDRQYGQVVGPDGFRSQGFAIGPDVQYKFGHALLRLKWQIEPIAHYKPQGSAVWFSAVLPL